MVKKILKLMGITIGVVIIALVVIGFVFINVSKEFGGKPTKEQLTTYNESGHYIQKDNQFENLVETSMDMGFKSIVGTMIEFIKGNPNGRPTKELPLIKIDSLQVAENQTKTRLIWFGHSAFLLQLEGKNILLDPMLGDVPAPHPLLGGKRYTKELPIEIEKLPTIDAIIISHDHYDHLDYGTIQKLKSRTKAFYVPLGVGAHFVAWGVDPAIIHEMNWWDETKLENIQLAFTPSRHFSGRGLTDRNSTLWGSWVIAGKEDTLFFSGDSGYGDHFKAIGDKYGPFDFAMMECGQYNEKWAQIHMMPEQTAQAGLDVQAKVLMPIHWGAFTLALHDWTDPVVRVTAEAKKLNLEVIIPKIGESIWLEDLKVSNSNWWKELI
jgi:L-ascorbate metabolism protein UlaG (beta-lactamase superfamily)